MTPCVPPWKRIWNKMSNFLYTFKIIWISTCCSQNVIYQSIEYVTKQNLIMKQRYVLCSYLFFFLLVVLYDVIFSVNWNLVQKKNIFFPFKFLFYSIISLGELNFGSKKSLILFISEKCFFRSEKRFFLVWRLKLFCSEK